MTQRADRESGFDKNDWTKSLGLWSLMTMKVHICCPADCSYIQRNVLSFLLMDRSVCVIYFFNKSFDWLVNQTELQS